MTDFFPIAINDVRPGRSRTPTLRNVPAHADRKIEVANLIQPSLGCFLGAGTLQVVGQCSWPARHGILEPRGRDVWLCSPASARRRVRGHFEGIGCVLAAAGGRSVGLAPGGAAQDADTAGGTNDEQTPGEFAEAEGNGQLLPVPADGAGPGGGHRAEPSVTRPVYSDQPDDMRQLP
jgi:hypothetical protein